MSDFPKSWGEQEVFDFRVRLGRQADRVILDDDLGLVAKLARVYAAQDEYESACSALENALSRDGLEARVCLDSEVERLEFMTVHALQTLVPPITVDRVFKLAQFLSSQESLSREDVDRAWWPVRRLLDLGSLRGLIKLFDGRLEPAEVMELCEMLPREFAVKAFLWHLDNN